MRVFLFHYLHAMMDQKLKQLKLNISQVAALNEEEKPALAEVLFAGQISTISVTTGEENEMDKITRKIKVNENELCVILK